jgi:hypothetical protein
MGEGTLSTESLTRILTPQPDYTHDEKGTHRITVDKPDLALILVRTFTRNDGTIAAEKRTVTQIELEDYMGSHLPELEARGVLDRQGRLIPQNRMLSVLCDVQKLFHTTPITPRVPKL